jgi:acyl-CoA thioester hydrolase
MSLLPFLSEPSMLTEHEIELRVRYSETDAMGFLHHSRFFAYFEIGRTELFRAGGGDYRAMEDGGLLLVVVKAECKFRSPARYDDVVTLRTKIARVGPVKLEHDYELTRDGKLLATGHTVLGCVDREGVVQRIPDEILSAIQEQE